VNYLSKENNFDSSGLPNIDMETRLGASAKVFPP
jgi:hypothetical protein